MLQTVALPNGASIRCPNPNNALLVYDEVFRDQVYFRNGIDVRDGDCIFDVGANIGLFLMQLNQRLRDATVYSFEPMPATFASLESNAREHNRLTLHLNNFGLSTSAGQATLHFYPHSPADSSRYPDDSAEAKAQGRDVVMNVMDGGSHIKLGSMSRFLLALTPRSLKRWIAERIRRRYMTAQQVDCRMDTLSNVIDRHQVKRIDLLKMDIEGGEFDALAGLRDEHWSIVKQMVLEVHNGEFAKMRMAALLDERGFDVVIEGDPLRPRNFLFFARRT